jgi:hypothetical protein
MYCTQNYLLAESVLTAATAWWICRRSILPYSHAGPLMTVTYRETETKHLSATQRNKVLLETLTVDQLVETLHIIHGTGSSLLSSYESDTELS